MKLNKTAIVGLMSLVCGVAAHATDITGAGSTFAAPIYSQWADSYRKAGGGRVNYIGIGSSGGFKQVVARMIDFAGTDAPLNDQDLARLGLFRFPTVVGALAVVVNIPGVKAGELTLSGPVLGDIYLGKISKWNDPAIAELNPQMNLPALPIAVVRRADSSGTSFLWTHYLAQTNPEWKSRVGEGTSVHWPHGTGGKGNDGLGALVEHISGAIGYVEWAYTRHNGLVYTALKNASGAVVQPGPETFQAAAAAADWSKSLYQIPTNEPGKDAWPLVGATFVLLHAVQDDPARGRETLKFFDWAFTNGAQEAHGLDYITLPEPVVSAIRAQWRTAIKDKSGEPVVGQ